MNKSNQVAIKETIKKLNWLLLKFEWNNNQWNHIINAKKEIKKLLPTEYITALDHFKKEQEKKK